MAELKGAIEEFQAILEELSSDGEWGNAESQ
jgi:hypothetical protein